MEIGQITTSDRAVQRKAAERNRKRNEALNLVTILPDRSWKGQRCFIIGGGPSLTGFDFERLWGERVIAINKAFASCMFADVLYFMDFIHFYTNIEDGRFGPEYLEKWKAFKGIKVHADSRGRDLPDVYWINLSSYQYGVSTSQKRGLFRGSNCGYGALNLAVLMRANPIYLLGYDMKHDGKITHFHEGYSRTAQGKALKTFIGELGAIRHDLKARRIKVVNLNPDSALKWFEFSTIDKVL
jgi:hypothetical protein